MVTNKCVHVKETGCFNTKLFQYRSFRYELKQWNWTKILVTSSKVWNWTRKFFWVNILYCLSQVRETIHTWKELTCIKTTLYRNYPWPMPAETKKIDCDVYCSSFKMIRYVTSNTHNPCCMSFYHEICAFNDFFSLFTGSARSNTGWHVRFYNPGQNYLRKCFH